MLAGIAPLILRADKGGHVFSERYDVKYASGKEREHLAISHKTGSVWFCSLFREVLSKGILEMATHGQKITFVDLNVLNFRPSMSKVVRPTRIEDV